jgi:hypothetical protein
LVQKPRVNLTSNIPPERTYFMLHKSSLTVFSHFSSAEKQLTENKKMMLLNGEVARIFLKVFSF